MKHETHINTWNAYKYHLSLYIAQYIDDWEMYK